MSCLDYFGVVIRIGVDVFKIFIVRAKALKAVVESKTCDSTRVCSTFEAKNGSWGKDLQPNRLCISRLR